MLFSYFALGFQYMQYNKIMSSENVKLESCKLVVKCSAIVMENDSEFEWSCNTGGIIHKRQRHSESETSKIQYIKLDQSSIFQERIESNKNVDMYGKLIILGYNGSLPRGDKGRKRSKFTLFKRLKSNGVRVSSHNQSKFSESSSIFRDASQYTLWYTMKKNQGVLVKYIPDENADMFQIGRSAENPIDFVVLDTISGIKKNRKVSEKANVSRFACRIVGDRQTKVCRIYASAFDNSSTMFLKENNPRWRDDSGYVDGLTVNGVLIQPPLSDFSSGSPRCGYIWLEVSITGKMLTQRDCRSSQEKGFVLEGRSNILEDGSLIDLCETTLLWRSAEGLAKSPNLQDLHEKIREILVSNPSYFQQHIRNNKIGYYAFVCLDCGHFQKIHKKFLHNEIKCFYCSKVESVVEANFGLEPAFYIDCAPLTFAFIPCGHISTEKTVKYWGEVSIPHGTNGYHSICPFCATPLTGSPGYIQLNFN